MNEGRSPEGPVFFVEGRSPLVNKLRFEPLSRFSIGGGIFPERDAQLSGEIQIVMGLLIMQKIAFAVVNAFPAGFRFDGFADI